MYERFLIQLKERKLGYLKKQLWLKKRNLEYIGRLLLLEPRKKIADDWIREYEKKRRERGVVRCQK